MKKLYMLFAILLVSTLLVVGCGGSSETTTTSQTTTPSQTTTSTQTSASSTTTAPSQTTTTSSTPTSSEPVQTGGILTIISNQSPTTFGYPMEHLSNASGFAQVPWVEGFFDSDVYGNLYPQLATSWEVSDDLSNITYHLREGVKFHDGTPFNAEAAKFSLDIYLEKGTGSPAAWTSVEVVDEYTVRINLKPDSFTNIQMTTSYGMISMEAYKEHGREWIELNPVGTGPFKFKSFVRDTSLEYERFDDYWGDKARVDGIKYIYIVDPTTAAMAFKAGDGLVWECADPKTSYDLVTNEGFKRETRRGPIYHLVPDSVHDDSPLSNVKVRQAIAIAINRQAIVDALGFGVWEAVDQPALPEQFSHVDEEFFPYDPDKAKALLVEAGYPDGLSTTIITATIFPQDMFVAIQSDLARVGITATIDVLSPPKWMETGLGGDYFNGFFVVTFAGTDFNYCAFLDRYFLPYSLFGAPAMSLPEGWVEKLEACLKMADPEDYMPETQELVRMFQEHVAAIPLWAADEVYLLNPRVHEMGVGTHGGGFPWDTNKVWIAQD